MFPRRTMRRRRLPGPAAPDPLYWLVQFTPSTL